MKTLLGVLLLAAATQAQAQTQPIENDLDGNASALQSSSEIPPRSARFPAR